MARIGEAGAEVSVPTEVPISAAMEPPTGEAIGEAVKVKEGVTLMQPSHSNTILVTVVHATTACPHSSAAGLTGFLEARQNGVKTRSRARGRIL